MADNSPGPGAHVFRIQPTAALPPALTYARRQLAGETQAGKTEHFVVFSDGSADGDAAAQAVLGVCEADFTAIQGFFGGIALPAGQEGDDQTTPRTAEPLQVAIDPQAGGAYHYGCDATDLYISPTPPSDAPGLVVAEVVEVFEAAINNGWDCGRTNGEALSRALAIARDAGLAPIVAHTAQSWWANGHQDYVNSNDADDQNEDANGCGTLFLYYLQAQLNFSWQQIATTGGATLGACYQTLTGQDPTQGFADFVNQLSTLDQGGQLALPASGNPFPIGAPAQGAAATAQPGSSQAVPAGAPGADIGAGLGYAAPADALQRTAPIVPPPDRLMPDALQPTAPIRPEARREADLPAGGQMPASAVPGSAGVSSALAIIIGVVIVVLALLLFFLVIHK